MIQVVRICIRQQQPYVGSRCMDEEKFPLKNEIAESIGRRLALAFWPARCKQTELPAVRAMSSVGVAEAGSIVNDFASQPARYASLCLRKSLTASRSLGVAACWFDDYKYWLLLPSGHHWIIHSR